jgi:glyoxylase-like metal-dependent hydrolase (beta-lactamase superfamily II)
MELVYEGDRVFVQKLSPHLYFRHADLLERQQCNSAYIVGEKATAVVDIPTINAAREIEAEIEHLFKLPLKYIFITHHHEDHIGGLGYFFDKPVTIICARGLVSYLRGTSGADFLGIEGASSLYLGQTEIRFWTMGRTMHSPFDVFVSIPTENALYSGDCVVEPWILYYHSADVEQWIAGLRELERRNFKTILPGHGGIFDGKAITETAEYLQVLLNLTNKIITEIKPAGHSDMNSAELETLTQDALSRPEAKLIVEKGRPEAERQFRMVFRKQLYAYLR